MIGLTFASTNLYTCHIAVYYQFNRFLLQYLCMLYSCAFIDLSLTDLYIVHIFYVCLSIFVYICLLLLLISNYGLISLFSVN